MLSGRSPFGPGPSSPAPATAAAVASPSAIAQTTSAPSVSPAAAGAVVLRANDVLTALKAKDGATLAAIVDPVKGARFSPYPYVRTDSDIVLSAAEIVRAFADPSCGCGATPTVGAMLSS
jgi:hypothetical protein